MKKVLLLGIIILLGNSIRYYCGMHDFRGNQSYRVREVLSILYKTIVYLMPCLLLFWASSRQSRKIYWSKSHVFMAMVLLIVLIIGKQYGGNHEINLNIFLMTYFYVLFVNSIIEEYVFRGIMLSWLQKELIFFYANCIQTIIFGLVHIPVYLILWGDGMRFVTALFGLMILGFRWGRVKKDTDSLIYPVILHSIWNCVLIFM